jgi:hypothetical protein
MLVSGKGGIGKSTLASQVRGQVTLNTDFLFSPVVNQGRHFYPEAQRRFDDEKRRLNGSIRRAWDALQNESEARRFMVETIARAIRLCDGCPLVVVEGYILQGLESDLRQSLGPDYRCWITRPEELNRAASTISEPNGPGNQLVQTSPRQLDSTREAK